MRKLLAIMLAAALLCGMNAAFAEGVEVIGGTQEVQNTSTFEDMLLDVPIDTGDYVFTVRKAEIKGAKLILEINVFNYLPKTVTFFKDAKVVVTYVGERGEYVFNGYGCYYSSVSGWYDNSDPSITVSQLSSDYARFGCDLPTYVIENQGELKMEVSYGSMVFTYYFRR